MGKKILFSPIGGTDPIKYFNDGSMIHICRVYQPDIVYLYLSKEMYDNHKHDNRYVKTLEYLGEHLHHTFEIHIIARENLVNVQQYDIYYKEFREIIADIQKDRNMAEDELLVNMASGTPAMKSALLIMATLAEYRFKAIQVSTPKKKINSEYEEREEYDIDANWELDEDNKQGFENRCEDVRCMNLVKLLKLDVLKKHLQAYDYHAALEIGEELLQDISEKAYRLLQIADARVKLNSRAISQLMQKENYDIYPIKESGKQKIFEYVLYLQMKLEKQEYADFIRGVTPIVVDLLKNILKTKCKINVDDYCNEVHGVKKWNKQKLREAELLPILDAEFKAGGGFSGGPVYSIHLRTLIIAKAEDSVLKEKVAQMIQIEQKVRNLAAHEIVSVTDDWFVQNCGYSGKAILSILRYLVTAAGIHADEESWKSYEHMNMLILKELGV